MSSRHSAQKQLPQSLINARPRILPTLRSDWSTFSSSPKRSSVSPEPVADMEPRLGGIVFNGAGSGDHQDENDPAEQFIRLIQCGVRNG